MKKIILPIFIAISSFSFGQKIAADLNFGTHAGSSVSIGTTASVGVSYKFTPLFSTRLDVGSDKFGDNMMTRITGNAVFDLSKLLKITDSKYSFSIYAGAGVTNRVNNQLFKDDYRVAGDGMINTVFGVMPKYKINEKFSLQLNASYFYLFASNTSMKNYVNTTFGVTYTY